MTQPANPRRILIVEDEDDMCWALRATLHTEGIHSTIAHSGQEALDRLRESCFELAFVDLKLPDIEGLDLVHQLRLEHPDLRCVLVSGYLYEDDEAVQTALKSGLISGFIGKPFALSQVREVLGLADAGRP